MGIAILLGACLIAFSMPVAIFTMVVARSAKLVILMIGGAFMWLVSALVTSIIWSAVTPLKEENAWIIIVGVAMQEVFRFAYWKLLKRAEEGLATLGDDGSGSATRPKQAMIAGLGFSLMSSVMQMNIVLNDAAGPGTLPARGCPGTSIFVISALVTMCFGILNIAWSIILHYGLEQTSQKGGSSMSCWQLWFVVVMHYIASFLTYAGDGANGCVITLVPLFLLLGPSGFFAYKFAGITPREAAD